MKINKLLQGVLLPSVVISPFIGLTACSETPICTLSWKEADGAFKYDSSIKLVPEQQMAWDAATQKYFDDVSKNYKIFTNDMLKLIVDGNHAFACNERIGSTHKYLNDFNDVADDQPEDSIKRSSYKITEASVRLYKWDTKTWRVTFEIEASFAAKDPSKFDGTGHAKFRVNNHPYCIYRGKKVDGQEWPRYANYDDCLGVEDEEKPDVPGIKRESNWAFMPLSTAVFYETAPWRGEIIDPRFGFGIGCQLMFMAEIGDWSMVLDESYDVPSKNLHAHYAMNYDQFSYKAAPSDIYDDAESFAYWKYLCNVYFFDLTNYFRNVKALGEE